MASATLDVQVKRRQFMKNLGLIGGLLLVLAEYKR